MVGQLVPHFTAALDSKGTVLNICPREPSPAEATNYGHACQPTTIKKADRDGMYCNSKMCALILAAVSRAEFEEAFANQERGDYVEKIDLESGKVNAGEDLERSSRTTGPR